MPVTFEDFHLVAFAPDPRVLTGVVDLKDGMSIRIMVPHDHPTAPYVIYYYHTNDDENFTTYEFGRDELLFRATIYELSKDTDTKLFMFPVKGSCFIPRLNRIYFVSLLTVALGCLVTTAAVAVVSIIVSLVGLLK